MSCTNNPSTHQTNGASLEDCLTNVFVLTELTGLKWKRYVTPDHSRGICGDLSTDAVLVAYGKCLSEGLLCVWRRAPPSPDLTTLSTKFDIQLGTDKELWIFWYGDEPESVKRCAINLSNPDSVGSSCGESGVEYVTRCLLFKALNNHLERCLLGKGYLRLGKWFVKPLEPADTAKASASSTMFVLSFTFSFFVHGERFVCASVQMQQQPSMRVLQRAHLHHTSKQKVLLAPWCLYGELVPVAESADLGSCTVAGGFAGSNREQQAQKQWNEWLLYYPLPTNDQTANMGYEDPEERERREQAKHTHLPKMVEVIVAGVRMFYPSSYVAVLSSEDLLASARASNTNSASVPSLFSATHSPNKQSANSCCAHDQSACSSSNTSSHSHSAKIKDAERHSERIHFDRAVAGCLLAQRTVEHLSLAVGTVPGHKQAAAASTNNTSTTSTAPTASMGTAQTGDTDTAPLNGAGLGSASGSSSSLNTEDMFTDVSEREHCACCLHLNGTQQPCTSGTNPTGSGTQSVPSKGALKHSSSSLSLSANTNTANGNNRYGNRFSNTPQHRRTLATSSIGATQPCPTSRPVTSAATNTHNTNTSTTQHGTPANSTGQPSATPVPATTSGTPAAPGGLTLQVSMSSESLVQMISPVDVNAPSNMPMSVPSTTCSHSQQPVTSALSCTAAELRVQKRKYDQTMSSGLDSVPSVSEQKDRGLSTLPASPTKHTHSVQYTNTKMGMGAAIRHKRRHSALLSESCPRLGVLDVDVCAELDGECVSVPLPSAHWLPNTGLSSWTVSHSTTTGVLLDQKSILDMTIYDERQDTAQIQPPAHWPDAPKHELPDEIMDTPKAVANLLPVYNSSALMSTNLMSPPNSNEQQMQHDTGTTRPTPSLLSALASNQPMTAGDPFSNLNNRVYGNPPSVDYIYPTPPSHDLHHQLSPEMINQNGAAVSSRPTSQTRQSPDTSHLNTSIEHKSVVKFLLGGAKIELLDENHGFAPAVEQKRSYGRCVQSSIYSVSAHSFSSSKVSLRAPLVCAQSLAQYKASSTGPCTAQTRTQSGAAGLGLVQNELNAHSPRHNMSIQRQQSLGTVGNMPNTAVAPGRAPNMRTMSSSSLGSPVPQSPVAGPGSVGSMYGLPAHGPVPLTRGNTFHHFGAPTTPAAMPVYHNPLSVGAPQSMHAFDSMQSPLRAPASVEPVGMMMSSGQQQLSGLSNQPGAGLSSGAVAGAAEAHSLVLTLLMSDSLLDLPRDVNFDSCPACACSTPNIRGHEVGYYLPGAMAQPNQQQQQYRVFGQCQCGFSAYRYRAMAHMSGLFHEDEDEAYAGDNSRGFRQKEQQNSMSFHQNKQGRLDTEELQLIDLVRQHSLTHDPATEVFGAALSEQQCVEMMHKRGGTFNLMKTHDDYYFAPIDMLTVKKLVMSAVEAACLVTDCTIPTRADQHRPNVQQQLVVHFWSYNRANFVPDVSECECYGVLQQLQPLVHQAVQQFVGKAALTATPCNDQTVANSNYVPQMEGPLSWRQLERKSVRYAGQNMQNVDDSGPEPIPQVLVSIERDQVSISPLSLRVWDRLLLEPLSQPKDVVYVAVLPDNKFIADRARLFLRELSKTYENHRLGKHCAFHKDGFPDGLLKVGKTTLRNGQLDSATLAAAKSSLEEETSQQRCHAYTLEHMVKPYKHICKFLATILDKEGAFDRHSVRDAGQGKDNQSQSAQSSAGASAGNNESMPPPCAMPDSSTGSMNESSTANTHSGYLNGADTELDEFGQCRLPHVVVIYMVNPFSLGPRTQDSRFAALYTRHLLKCYQALVDNLSVERRPYVQLQMVPLHSLLDVSGVLVDYAKQYRDQAFTNVTENACWLSSRSLSRQGAAESLRQLALSVYTQSRAVHASHCLPGSLPKSLTGFGPAASRAVLMHKLDACPLSSTLPGGFPLKVMHKLQCENQGLQHIYREYSAPYSLAMGTRALHPQTATSTTLDMVQNGGSSSQQQHHSQEQVLFVGYCLSEDQRFLLATATNHNGTTLDSAVINMADFCSKTHPLQPNMRQLAKPMNVTRAALNRLWKFVLGVLGASCRPTRLVIGRLGRLGHSEVKVWAQLLNQKNLKNYVNLLSEFCQYCKHTPGSDRAHILSACVVALEPELNIRLLPGQVVPDPKFGQSARACPLNTPDDVSTTHIMVFPTSAHLQLPQPGELPFEMEMDDFHLGAIDMDMDYGIDITKLADDNMDNKTAAGVAGCNSTDHDLDTFTLNMSQQPLAVGVYVSTAPAPGLPTWFWSACPAARHRCPVHLKASLHISVQVQDDNQLMNMKLLSEQPHPLENHHFDESLRYVLEMYNALSWLDMDLATGDRRSCLPLHLQALLRLHRSTSVFCTR